MGNQQSNERKPNYKIYKITNKSVGSDYIRCYLDDYVPYSNGNYKHMDFVKIPTLLSVGAFFAGADTGASLCEGCYIAIDIDMTRGYSSGREFHPCSVKEVRGSNGSLLRDTLELIEGAYDIIEERREFRAQIEQSRYDRDVWRKQTSRDIP